MHAFMATVHNPHASLLHCTTKSHSSWQEKELTFLRWVMSWGGSWYKGTTGEHLSAEASGRQGPVSQHARGIGLCMVALAAATSTGPPAHPTSLPGTQHPVQHCKWGLHTRAMGSI